jgi:hypothetical protein
MRVERRGLGLNWADVCRVLRYLAAGQGVSVSVQSAAIDWMDGRGLTVVVDAIYERRLANLTLPALDLAFEFTGFAAAEFELFMARFDRASQKGGG